MDNWIQTNSWCEGSASGRVVPEEVRVPAAAGGAAGRADAGDGQGGGRQPQLPPAQGGRVRVFYLLINDTGMKKKMSTFETIDL